MRYTKGPWNWRGPEKWGEFEVEFLSLDGADGEDVIRVEDVYVGYPECGEELRIICSPQDARLIAAAPELLEALKACLTRMKDDGYHSDEVEWAEDAIAKAEGK